NNRNVRGVGFLRPAKAPQRRCSSSASLRWHSPPPLRCHFHPPAAPRPASETLGDAAGTDVYALPAPWTRRTPRIEPCCPLGAATGRNSCGSHGAQKFWNLDLTPDWIRNLALAWLAVLPSLPKAAEATPSPGPLS